MSEAWMVEGTYALCLLEAAGYGEGREWRVYNRQITDEGSESINLASKNVEAKDQAVKKVKGSKSYAIELLLMAGCSAVQYQLQVVCRNVKAQRLTGPSLWAEHLEKELVGMII